MPPKKASPVNKGSAPSASPPKGKQGTTKNEKKNTTSQPLSQSGGASSGVTIDAKPEGFSESVLNPVETWWQAQGQWLGTCGYELRPRYRKGWSPSWVRPGVKQSSLNKAKFEDAQIIRHAYILDAIRKKDGKQVCLKRVRTQDHPHEVEITGKLSETQTPNRVENHCVPVYDTLRPPNDTQWTIIVMPLLLPFDVPKWETLGEVLEFIRQIFEGLNYIHSQGVAHRDCGVLNIMMDASHICPDGFHPIARHMNRDFTRPARFLTRTETRPKYYFIDFGLSARYNTSKPPVQAQFIGSGDKAVPEFQGQKRTQLYDPFAADVYMLGNVVRITFLEGKSKPSFVALQPLVKRMMDTDPTKRPKMPQVVQEYKTLLEKSFPASKLRARVAGSGGGLFAGLSHWLKQRKFTKLGYPALPSPTSLPAGGRSNGATTSQPVSTATGPNPNNRAQQPAGSVTKNLPSQSTPKTKPKKSEKKADKPGKGKAQSKRVKGG